MNIYSFPIAIIWASVSVTLGQQVTRIASMRRGPGFATPRPPILARCPGHKRTPSKGNAKLDKGRSYRYPTFHAFVPTFSRKRRFDVLLQAVRRTLTIPQAAFEGILQSGDGFRQTGDIKKIGEGKCRSLAIVRMLWGKRLLMNWLTIEEDVSS